MSSVIPNVTLDLDPVLFVPSRRDVGEYCIGIDGPSTRSGFRRARVHGEISRSDASVNSPTEPSSGTPGFGPAADSAHEPTVLHGPISLPGGSGLQLHSILAPSAAPARSLRSLSLLRSVLGRLSGSGVVSQANPAPPGTEGRIQMNIVKLNGRLTRDPEYGERSETKVCDMRLAVNGTGKTPTIFIDVAAFGEQAQAAAELKKGAEVEVTGSLRYSEWEAKTSSGSKKTQKRSKHSVIVRELVAA